MEYTRLLLSGEDVQAEWSGMAARPLAETVRYLLQQIDRHGEPFAFTTVLDETLEVAGGRIPIGWVMRYVASAWMSNLDEVRTWYQAGAEGTIEVRLEPADNNDMTIRHMPGGPPAPELQAGARDPDTE